MRTCPWLIGATLAVASCHDSAGPSEPVRGAPGLQLISGFDVTDTVTAKPPTALVVEVRDSMGVIAPRGTLVRFTASGMLAEGLTSASFASVVDAMTDSTGRVAVLVQLGTVPGPARIGIWAPQIGEQDTARYTVLPGAPSRIVLAPLDTAMYVGRTFTMRGSVVDRFDNVRSNEPLAYGGSSAGLSVSGSGVVSASAIGRYALTATSGDLSASNAVSVVPQGTLAAMLIVDNQQHVVSVELDGSGYRDLTGAYFSYADGMAARWIPGTSTIVYTGVAGGNQVLLTVDQAGKIGTFLPNPPTTMANPADPSPSRHAPVLYFSAYDSRCPMFVFCLFRSGIDGTAPELLRALVSPYDFNWRAAAAPDGSKVAYSELGTMIRVFDYATKTVLPWRIYGDYPAWSPDGAHIAFVGGGGHLWLIDPDGTNQQLVTPLDHYYFEGAPVSWSPDGKWLIALGYPTYRLELVEVATGNALPLGYTSTYVAADWK